MAAHRLEVGYAVADISPPLDVNLQVPDGAYLPGQPRKYEAIRQRPEARCLVLRAGDTSAAIVSIDLLGVSSEFCDGVRSLFSDKSDIRGLHICATHTHSMPSFKKLRFHGEPSAKYIATVEEQIVAALREAEQNLAPATLEVGTALAKDASYNRTAKQWKPEEQFDKNSSDADRWLDRTVHVLRFRRDKQPDLIWYHFSAHPVAFRDDPRAGPDWPGLVNRAIADKLHARGSFLQGHCGDVNSGDGSTQLGDADRVAEIVFAAIENALEKAKSVEVEQLTTRTETFAVQLDLERMNADRERFEANPAKTVQESGWYKDVDFGRDWAKWAKTWDQKQTTYSTPLSAIGLGSVALAFHPGELYSGYGLMLRRDSPFEHTIAVGYADNLIGYLPDPAAYAKGEYAAITVPKILYLPQFKPTAAQQLTDALLNLLKKAHAE